MPLANPKVSATLRAAGTTVGLTDEKVLFVGSLTGGTAVSGDLQENILTEADALGLFGSTAPLTKAIGVGRERNTETRFDAIGIADDGSAVDAVGTFTVTGTATADGTITVSIGSLKNETVTATILDTDADTDIAIKINNAIVTATDAAKFYVSSSVATTIVTLTARTGGTFGNGISMSVIVDVPGVTVAVAAMAGGATDPDLTGVFDVIGAQRYQGIIWQFDQDLTELTGFLDPRFNATNDILDGVGFVGINDTLANGLVTLNAENSESLSINLDNKITSATHTGSALQEIGFIRVAEFGAVRALRRTTGAILGNNVIARSTLDTIGGIRLNSKPYFNTPLPNILVPDLGLTFTDQEVDQIEDAGGWVIDSNRALSAVITGTLETTYKTDVAGNPDPTFGKLNFVDTSSASREYIVNNTRAQYPQFRATSGTLINGVDSANVASVRAFVSGLNTDLADFGLVAQGLGELDGEEVDFDKLFRENLTVTLDSVTGTFTIGAKLFIVTQARVFIFDLAIAFEE